MATAQNVRCNLVSHDSYLSDLIFYSFPLAHSTLASLPSLLFLIYARHILPLLYPLQEVAPPLCKWPSLILRIFTRETFPDHQCQVETAYPDTISFTWLFSFLAIIIIGDSSVCQVCPVFPNTQNDCTS